MPQQISRRCLRYSGERRALRVLRSGAGYYVGTLDDEGLPYSRDSVEYFATEAQAEDALASGSFTIREHP